MTNIGFIGGGNIATALISGLARQPQPASIMVSDPNISVGKRLAQDFNVKVAADNTTLARECDVIILAVKPNIVPAVCSDIAPSLGTSALVISIAAGVTTQTLISNLSVDVALVRAMPNTPATIQRGITALYATPQVSDQQRQHAEDIASAAGDVLWIDEEHLMDAVTAVSGSGPAYVFWLMEQMITAAQKLGLSDQQAERLVFATVAGAAAMPEQTSTSPKALRKAVTSPGGTTAAALDCFQQNNLDQHMLEAITAAHRRSRQLSDAS